MPLQSTSRQTLVTMVNCRCCHSLAKSMKNRKLTPLYMCVYFAPNDFFFTIFFTCRGRGFRLVNCPSQARGVPEMVSPKQLEPGEKLGSRARRGAQ